MRTEGNDRMNELPMYPASPYGLGLDTRAMSTVISRWPLFLLRRLGFSDGKSEHVGTLKITESLILRFLFNFHLVSEGYSGPADNSSPTLSPTKASSFLSHFGRG